MEILKQQQQNNNDQNKNSQDDPSVGEWINKLVITSIHPMKYFALKRKELPSQDKI